MAIIKPPFEIVGSIRGMSFYKQYGSDKVIMRTKGGATKQKIKNSPKFAKLRLHQTEWGGCVKMSRAICCALWRVIPLADFNVSAYLNGFSKKLQALDTEMPVGERRILLSKNKYLLDGFQLNRIHTFASILRVAPFWEIKRETLEARVEIPYINTDIHLVNPNNLPYFRIIACLGFVSDMHQIENGKEYVPNNINLDSFTFEQHTEWYSTNRQIPAQELIIKYEDQYVSDLTDDISMILSIGVEFGKPGFDNQPVEVKRAGCAKVLGVK